VSITSSGDLDLLEIPSPDVNSEKRVEFRQEVEAVMAALNALPEACRETLILRRVEGMPQKEVAARLKISEKTVEKYMANGVRLLIKSFGRGGKPRASSSSIQELNGLEDVSKKPRD
jgi:RNA polymerase sigma-70 factor (ECF subfamily)